MQTNSPFGPPPSTAKRVQKKVSPSGGDPYKDLLKCVHASARKKVVAHRDGGGVDSARQIDKRVMDRSSPPPIAVQASTRGSWHAKGDRTASSRSQGCIGETDRSSGPLARHEKPVPDPEVLERDLSLHLANLEVSAPAIALFPDSPLQQP